MRNINEYVNEIILGVLIILLVSMTDFLTNNEIRYFMGWVIILIVYA